MGEKIIRISNNLNPLTKILQLVLMQISFFVKPILIYPYKNLYSVTYWY